MRRALLLEPLQLPMQPPRVLGFDTGHAHPPPPRSFARVIAHQHPHQPRAFQPVGLGAPLPAIHLDAGRVHDQILDARLAQPPMNPKPIAARFIHRAHRRISRQPEVALGLSDRLLQAGEVAGRHIDLADFDAITEGQFPIALAEFDRHE